MAEQQRTPVLTATAFAVTGAAGGFLLQIARSGLGSPPFVPPYSLAVTLLAFAAILVLLGILLRRAIVGEHGRRVNPFHAVRLLAGARAAQFVGALFGGFGAGLAVQLLMRSVPAPVATWMPMVSMLVTGVVLAVVGAIVEGWCRVPPGDGGAPGGDGDGAQREDLGPREEPGAASGSATPTATRNEER